MANPLFVADTACPACHGTTTSAAYDPAAVPLGPLLSVRDLILDLKGAPDAMLELTNEDGVTTYRLPRPRGKAGRIRFLKAARKVLPGRRILLVCGCGCEELHRVEITT